MIKLVVFDLDNVIIDGEGIDEIGKLINIEDQIAAITEQAMQGDIDFETSIKKRVGLLKGVATEDIKTLANEMPLMKGAEETVSTLKENGFDVAIISGSFDIIADTIKGKLDVDNVFTNSLVEEDGILTGEVTGPLVSGSKLDVLSKLIEEKGYTLDECVAVGDGANDISMIESAKYGIAFADVDKEVAVETEVVETTDVVVENQEEEQVADATEEVVEEIEETEEVVEEAPEEEVAEEETAEEEAEAEEEAVEEEVAEAEEEAAEETEVVEEAEEEVAEEKPVKEAKPKKSKKKNALPEPDFDLADTIEGVEAKEQRKIRDELNSELKENLAKAIEFRDQRNEINKQVEENKKARNKVNDEIKSLEWSSGKKDKIRIEAEIKKIDKIIETRVLDIKKENQLVKNANDLRKELAEIKEDDKVKEEAAELKKKSEEYHAKVVELSEQAQEAHEQMLSYFRKTDEIRTAADEAHKLFIQARKNASAKHEEFKMILSEIHVINKKLGSNKNRKRRSDKSGGSSNNKKNREEKERAESIFDKFKNGKKLSTEELLLLQKYDIN